MVISEGFVMGFGFCLTFGLFLATIADSEHKNSFFVHLIGASIIMGLIVKRLVGS